MKTLTVICPVYNEESVITQFFEQLDKTLLPLRDHYQANILFVVDRSSDRTMEILRDLAGKHSYVQVLGLSARFGHQMALVAGMDHADSDAIIMMDSDLQHPPALIPEMLRHFEEGYDIVYTVRNDTFDTGFLKRFTSKLFYRLINKISEVAIDESAADFRLISRRVAKVFQERIREHNQFLRGLFGWVGFRRIGISFDVGKRAGGRSKYSLTRLLTFATQGVVSFSKRPLQAAVLLGLAAAAFGALMVIVTFVQFLVYKHLPSGWTTLVILISGFGGTHLMFLGIIGEYIGAIFDEVKARPHYIVEEKVNFNAESFRRVA